MQVRCLRFLARSLERFILIDSMFAMGSEPGKAFDHVTGVTSQTKSHTKDKGKKLLLLSGKLGKKINWSL